jgi:hypothetical protein
MNPNRRSRIRKLGKDAKSSGSFLFKDAGVLQVPAKKVEGLHILLPHNVSAKAHAEAVRFAQKEARLASKKRVALTAKEVTEGMRVTSIAQKELIKFVGENDGVIELTHPGWSSHKVRFAVADGKLNVVVVPPRAKEEVITDAAGRAKWIMWAVKKLSPE